MGTTCTHCGKQLTDPVSILRGIGPDCWRKRLDEGRTRNGNLFGNHAEFTWGIDANILWLKDNGGPGRSLTNDMENALVRIQAELDQTPINAYTIVYMDSDGVWDGVRLTRFNLKAVFLDYQWLSDGRYPNYFSQGLEVDFYWIGEASYQAAKAKVLSAAQEAG